jgi:hypothetical protein
MNDLKGNRGTPRNPAQCHSGHHRSRI